MAQSTFCRKCGDYFEIRKPSPDGKTEADSDSFFRRLGKLVSGEKKITIKCYACGARQVVSDIAKSSLCPGCGHYIDLRDHKITTVFSRTIETQGVVTIAARADVSSTKITCREAHVYGKLRGQLVCTGETHIKQKGKIFGGIESQDLIVEKRSDVEFSRVLKVCNATIHGKAYARIDADGVVNISKTGELEGSIHAKSIIVEKGGKFTGELYIGKQVMEQQELLPVSSGAAADVFDKKFSQKLA
jgi:cytoskeletal protein CcmA (bactofilin family)